MNQEEYVEAAAEQALETLLWSEVIDLPADGDEVILPSVPEDMRDQQGKPFDSFYEARDLQDVTINKIKSDVRKFVEANWLDLWLSQPEQAGHDFILARNETGSGFTSHVYSDEIQREVWQRLQASAEKFNLISLYLGDDLKIYHWSEES